MKRFIRYLYEYDGERRTRNVGFVKVECDYEVCTIHIHGKGLRMGEDRKLSLYLFYEEEGKCIGIKQGESRNVNPAVNHRIRYTPEETGKPQNFDKIRGVVMENESGVKYASVWDDAPADVGNMISWEDWQREKAMPEEVQPEENQEGELQLEETPSELTEEVAEQAQIRKLTKIQRKDLVRLPRCEWRLSNNSFLLHGYYNYHYLALLEEGQCQWIGVPGIYHEREMKMAETYGFPEFISKKEWEESLLSEENDGKETFGYWCRKIHI